MTHLGHRLSALIDGELDAVERDRVLVHLAGCEPCRGEAIALRTLKRRMNALGEAAADAALTRRLIGLAQERGASTVAELEEVIYHAASYAGFPAAASARDIVREALKKAGMLPDPAHGPRT